MKQSNGCAALRRRATEIIDEVLTGFPRGAGDSTLVAVRECCELDVALVGYGGILLLQSGLNYLAELWALGGRGHG